MAGGSNVNPRLFVDLYEAAAAADVNRVATLHQQVIQFDNGVYRTAEDPHNPLRGLKAALSVMGICGEAITPPLRPISTRERETIAQYLRGVESTSAAYPSR
jgi:dihydrodipicolinate synthase/N-acetylneuraminate lyase